MTNQEKELFQVVPCNEFNTYWIPCTWFVYRIQEAAKKGKLVNAYALETIMREFCEFRAKCGLLWCYDWVSIPMVYTQVSNNIFFLNLNFSNASYIRLLPWPPMFSSFSPSLDVRTLAMMKLWEEGNHKSLCAVDE